MKYIYSIGISIAIFLGFTIQSQAQATLGLTTTSVSSSTPPLGSQLSIFTMLKNTSTTDTFSGIVNFQLANKDSIHTIASVVGMPTFAGTVVTLAPQEQRSALFTVQLLSSYFSIGTDIIIVWPVASSVRITDSARAPISIQPALSISELDNDSLRLFVSNGHLIIHNQGAKIILEQVHICDIIGRRIISHSASDIDIDIPLDGLPSNIYFAEIVLTNGETKTIRFYK